jgi:DegV family protein with EDD domain
MPVRLVADSTCDLPADLVARYDIRVVPAILNLEGRSYRDGLDLSRAEFYARLPGLRALPSTAAPAAGEFEAAYRACGDADILSIHLASQLSALYNAARLAAESFGGRVTLIDSGQVSMGIGWQVLAAAEAVAAGKPLADVIAAAESTRRRVKLFALLDTIEFLRRGGRASAFAATLGDLLQIKPLLEVADGQVLPVARLRTRAKGLAALVERVESLGPLERLAVLHANTPADAQSLADRLAGRSAQPALVLEATTVIGTHAGPGALGIAAVKAVVE